MTGHQGHDENAARRISIDELLAAWEQTWLKSVANQIYELHNRREIHDEFLHMLEVQEHRDRSYFGDVFHHMYLESQTMAIRRQVDNDPRTLSLRRLMGQLQEHRRDFTREWYVHRWMAKLDGKSGCRQEYERRLHLDMANTAFDQFVDRPGDSFLSAGRLARDRNELDSITDKVVQYVNEHVAHIAARPTGVSVSYDEFNRAVDHFGEMLKRYYLLIKQSGLVNATPTIQGDWKGPFRRPLA